MNVYELTLLLYRLLLRLYPSRIRLELGDEMQAVFAQALVEARRAGGSSLSTLLLREMFQTPLALARAYQPGGIGRKPVEPHLPEPGAALQPPGFDGRFSWRQAGLETALFLAAGGLLVLATYLPPDWLAAGWQRRLDLLGVGVFLLPAPVFVAGLVNGLTRWAYPAGGLLLSYIFLAAARSHLLPFLVTSLAAASSLAAAAWFINVYCCPLPAGVRRLGQSLQQDWTRLSFAFYGAMPLAITIAYDDAYLNSRTPWLAISALLMTCGALAYARSRRPAFQMAALLAGFTLSFWAALPDRAFFEGGPGPWLATTGWMVELWAGLAALMLAPSLLGYAQIALAPRLPRPQKRSGQ